MQRVYNKATEIQEQETHRILPEHKKKTNKASYILESDSLGRWNQDKLVSEWWNENRKRKAWRRKRTSHDLKNTCVKHGGGSIIAWACMVADGTGSLMFTDYVTADRWSKMILFIFKWVEFWDVYGYILCSHSVSCYIKDNNPKHVVKATQDFLKLKKLKILQWQSQSEFNHRDLARFDGDGDLLPEFTKEFLSLRPNTFEPLKMQVLCLKWQDEGR